MSATAGQRRLTTERLRGFWSAHRTTFWALHSVWALATGVAVIVLARERYGFVPWVVLFLGATWASTLFFGRRLTRESGEEDQDRPAPAMKDEAASYLTRTMYQETLFFLLPFYAYSTVLGSPNVLFILVLGGLAVLSCLDLVFDRWLRRSPLFSLLFFALVAFAAANLLLPLLLPIDPTLATRLAVLGAVTSAAPLALQGPAWGRGTSWRLASLGAALIAVVIAFPGWVPPVPLRVESSIFASDIDRGTLEVADTLHDGVSAGELGDALFVRLEIFAPSVVPTTVSLEWLKDGEPLRTSREVAITAHELGFRFWDAWRPDSMEIPPGRYQVVARASQGRVFGTAGLRVR